MQEIQTERQVQQVVGTRDTSRALSRPNFKASCTKLAIGALIIGSMIANACMSQLVDSQSIMDPKDNLQFETFEGLDNLGTGGTSPSTNSQDMMTMEQFQVLMQFNKYTLLLLLKGASVDGSSLEKLFRRYEKVTRIPELHFKVIDCDAELEIGSYFGLIVHSRIVLYIDGVEPQVFTRKTMNLDVLYTWVETAFIHYLPIQKVTSLRQALHEISPRKESALIYFGLEDQNLDDQFKDLKTLHQVRPHIQYVKFCFGDRKLSSLGEFDDSLAIVVMIAEDGSIVQERIKGDFSHATIIKKCLSMRTPWTISLNLPDDDWQLTPQDMEKIPFLMMFYKDMEPSYQEFRAASAHYKHKINFFYCSVRIPECLAFSKVFGVLQVPMIVMGHPGVEWARIFFTDLISTMRIVKFVESTIAGFKLALNKKRAAG